MNKKDFPQMVWRELLDVRCHELIHVAMREDLMGGQDWTSCILVPSETKGDACVVARHAGIIAGLRAVAAMLDEKYPQVDWQPQVEDGEAVDAGALVAKLSGNADCLLLLERTILNLMGHLSGIATLTRRYVDAVAGTKACIYDTRKTLIGLRYLEKYAVHCGGGRNHRLSLSHAILIKDNHLAFLRNSGQSITLADAVLRARKLIAFKTQRKSMRDGLCEGDLPPEREYVREVFSVDNSHLTPWDANMMVEIEVDSLSQLEEVLPACPDIVLLDNMSLDQLRQAVAMRDAAKQSNKADSPDNPDVELEASGGVDLSTVRAIAETGVDRISVGALTHSAPNFDLGLDWN